ncbi:hypothetical protein ACS0TY_035618 [Phlomoides rotata]
MQIHMWTLYRKSSKRLTYQQKKNSMQFGKGEINLKPQTDPKWVDTNIAVHGKIYSNDRDSGQNILLLMYLDSERSHNYKNGFLMQSTSLGIITLILKEVKN